MGKLLFKSKICYSLCNTIIDIFLLIIPSHAEFLIYQYFCKLRVQSGLLGSGTYQRACWESPGTYMTEGRLECIVRNPCCFFFLIPKLNNHDNSFKLSFQPSKIMKPKKVTTRCTKPITSLGLCCN